MPSRWRFPCPGDHGAPAWCSAYWIAVRVLIRPSWAASSTPLFAATVLAADRTGLGLAIVKRIAALHGGSVEEFAAPLSGLKPCLPLGLLLPRDAV